MSNVQIYSRTERFESPAEKTERGTGGVSANQFL